MLGARGARARRILSSLVGAPNTGRRCLGSEAAVAFPSSRCTQSPLASAALAASAVAAIAWGAKQRSVNAEALAEMKAPIKLHVYDHCPYCQRARLAMGWLGIPHQLVLYCYGEGANPKKCDGHGYNPKGGPVKLTGKKTLPVLEADGVPTQGGMQGLPESLEICSYAAACAPSGKRLPPATGRSDLNKWLKSMGEVSPKLIRPRLLKVPVKDWEDPRDVDYVKWKHERQGFDYAAADAATPELLEEASALLKTLEPLLRGEEDGVPCLNAWGLSMDDVLLLPTLRNLTCVAGLQWPPKVYSYVEKACGKAGVKLYTQYAC